MPLATGARLGPYEIGAPIGKGGMGEVAIKILPEELAADDDVLPVRGRLDVWRAWSE